MSVNRSEVSRSLAKAIAYAGCGKPDCQEYATHTVREGGMTVDACDACDPQLPYEL